MSKYASLFDVEDSPPSRYAALFEESSDSTAQPVAEEAPAVAVSDVAQSAPVSDAPVDMASAIVEPKVPDSGFFRSFAGSAAQGSLLTAAAAADAAGAVKTELAPMKGGKAYRTEDQSELARLSAELDAVRNEPAPSNTGYFGQTTGDYYRDKELRMESIAREIQRLQSPPPNETAAEEMRNAAGQAFEHYGANPESKNFAAQVGRGAGAFTANVPAIVLNLPLAAAQMAGTTYESAYLQKEQEMRAKGVTDENAISEEAQKTASAEAVKSAPHLAAYIAGGKLASAAVAKLLPAGSAVLKGVAGAAAGTAANVTVGGVNRMMEGQPFLPTTEQLTQDVLWGIVHGKGEYQGERAKLEVQRRAEAAALHLEEADMPNAAEAVRKTAEAQPAPEAVAPVEEAVPAAAPEPATAPEESAPVVTKSVSETTPPAAAPVAPSEQFSVGDRVAYGGKSATVEAVDDPVSGYVVRFDGDSLPTGMGNGEGMTLAESSPAPAPLQFKLPKRAEEAGDVMVNVKISAFDPVFQKDQGFYVGPGGEGGIRGRREGFQKFMQKGVPIETPEVNVDASGQVAFVNGRHRYSVLRDQGVETMPMAMSPESAENARKAGLLAEDVNESGFVDTPAVEALPTPAEPISEPAKPAVPEPSAKLEQKPAQPTFAQSVVKAANAVPETRKMGPKAAISAVYDQWKAQGGKASLDEFKSMLVDESRKGSLVLGREDFGINIMRDKFGMKELADALDTSETQDGREVLHYLNIDESRTAADRHARTNETSRTPEPPIEPATSATESRPANPELLAKPGEQAGTEGGAKRDLTPDPSFDEDPVVAYLMKNGGVKQEAVGKPLSNPNHERVFSDTGLTPKEATLMLVRDGLLSPGSTPEDLKIALQWASEAAETLRRNAGRESRRTPEPEQQTNGSNGEPPKPPTPPAEPLDRESGTTSIQNKVVDEERVKRGRAPAMEPLRRSFGTVWDEAMQRIDRNADEPRMLTEDLIRKPRPITDTEDAMLLHRQVTLQNEFDRAIEEINRASESGNEGLVEENRLRQAYLGDELQKLYDIGKRVGTENARGLNARKMMAREDYTLARMMARKRAENGGKPLSPEVEKEVTEQAEKIKKARETEDAATAKADETRATAVAEEAVKEVVKKVRPSKPKTPKAGNEAAAPSKRTATWLEKKAEAAKKRIQERKKKTFADPFGALTAIDLADRAIVCAADIAGGLRTFSAWASKAVSEWGESVRPHLQNIWDRGNAIIAQHESNAAIAEKMAARVADGATIGELRSYVRKMAENIVRGGVTELDTLLNELHPMVEDVVPGTTRRQTMDVFSGYGDYRQLSKDAIDVQIRDLKGQGQQIGKIEDMQAGLPPKKTGVEQRTPSDKERRLTKEVERLKKQGNFKVTDPETQLRSALQAQERALSNAIKDIATEIDTGERRAPTGTSPTNDRIEMLKALLGRLRQTREEVFGSKNKDITDEQRLKLAIDAANRTAEEYERQVREEDFAQKKGKPTLTSLELEAAKARRDAAKAERDELKELADQIEGRDAERREKQLTDQIAEIDRRLKEGDFSKKTNGAKDEPSGTADFLKAQRDAMQKELDRQRRAADPRRAPSEVEKRKIEKLQKDIAELDRKLKTGDLGTKPKPTPNDSNEAEALKAEREALQKELQRQRREAAKPVLTPAEKEAAANRRALKAYKKRTAQKIADLQARLAKGDFSPTPPRRVLQMDADALKAQADLQRAKNDYERGLIRDRLNKRTLTEKGLEGVAKWRRAFVLSGVHTLGKLTSAAAEIVSIAPVEEAVGGAIGKLPVLGRVAAKAPRHGGLNLTAEIEAITETVTKLFKDSAKYMKEGGLDIDEVYGKPHLYPFEWKELIGRMHGALKTPARRNEWTRSFRKRMDHAARNGVDITDPMVQMKIGVDAYKDAQRSIFMEYNMVVDAYSRALSRFGQVNKETGRPSTLGKTAETTLKVLLPVVRIPTNIVARTFEYTLGTVGGSVRLAKAMSKGIENIKPEEADLIMRNLKRGSLGAAVLLLGYFNPQTVGGYYHGKRDEEDVKEGGLRVFGVNIPKFLIHNPLLEQLQIGATIRRVSDSKLRKKDKDTQGLGEGIWAGALGLTEEVPFVSQMLRTAEAFSPTGRKYFLGELSRSVIPQGVQEAARFSDRNPATGETYKRTPRNTWEYIESGIPGLRQRVPLTNKKK